MALFFHPSRIIRAKDQAYEFLFVLGPLLLRGGIGVPINPIAIR